MDPTKRKKNGGEGTNVGNALRWLVKQGKTVAPEILSAAGTLTGIESLKKLGELIGSDPQISEADKNLLLAEIELDKTREEEISKRWEADLHSDSWLSKNIRPMTLSFLLFNMFVFIVLDSSLEGFKIASEWIDLLKTLLVTAVGGYFVIRGGEKMMNKWKE
jgi:hypothetical protein